MSVGLGLVFVCLFTFSIFCVFLFFAETMPYSVEQAIIFFALWFLLSSFFPRLISAVADWMSAIFPHMVWPSCEFKMQV